LFRAGPPIKNGAVLGFLTVRDEALRLPAVLDHHRRFGIDQFVIVDNDSNDGTRDLLAAMPDVRLYSDSGSFAASNFGLQWLHPLLDELTDNHWALILDADELFVFPCCERLTLHQLCHFLDHEGSDSIFAIQLDMYSQSSIAATAYRQGESLLDASPFFDPGPYAAVRSPDFPYFEFRGGQRARAFWTPAMPFHAPTVSKVPLVKWQRGYRYTDSATAR
jgi:glycosyltransferase involved in cell wall biosynthesis